MCRQGRANLASFPPDDVGVPKKSIFDTNNISLCWQKVCICSPSSSFGHNYNSNTSSTSIKSSSSRIKENNNKNQTLFAYYQL